MWPVTNKRKGKANAGILRAVQKQIKSA